ncbi:MAG: PAS domain S-box protein [Bacteroidales bacterium]|nr:PAS domain S-box protein [Bacteroidales bacterium]
MNKNFTKQELHDEVKGLRLQLTEKSESAQAMLLDNIMHSLTKMSVIATDIDLNVIFFSRRAEQIFRYKASEVIGKNLTEIHAMEKVKFSRIENAIKIIKKTGNYECLVNQKTENGIRHLKLKASCILDKNKNISGFVLLTTDKTKEIIAEKKLQKSEKKFRDVIDNAGDGILIGNMKGNIITANKSICKLTGYTKSELTGKHIGFIFSKKMLEEEPLKFDELDKGETIIKERRIKGKKGNEIPIEMNSKRLDNKNYIAVFRDLTEREKTKVLIRKLSTAVKQSANTIVITDTEGNIEYTNPEFTKLTGYTAEEVLGKNFRIINAGKLPKEHYVELWQTITQGNIWKGKLYNEKKNGDYFWEQVTITPIKNESGKIVNYLAIKEDITARKKAEEALKENEEYFRTLIENSTDVISILDNKGNIMYESPAHKYVLGYRKGELAGKNSFELVHPDDRDRILVQFTKLLKNPKNFENVNFRYLHKDGTWLHLEGTGKNLLNSPKINGIVVNYRDVSARKKAEQELKRQNEEYASLNEEYLIQNEELIKAKEKAEESDRLKTEFINNMSHEIRTPMNGILGFSQLLYKRELAEEKRKHYINIIQNSGNQLLYIINNILEISKLGSKQIKSSDKNVCLNDLLLELFSIFDIKAKENKISFYLKKGLSDKESTIMTDPKILKKVLSNLLDNALKFTNNGFVEFGYRLVQTKHALSQLEIYVKDTGTGIRPEKQKIIFEPFSQEETRLTEKIDGLGLGLAISKENAKLIGGKITLISEKGKGSTFFVTIPYKIVYKETIKELLSATKLKKLVKEKYTILIAEDEEVNYLYLETLLVDESELTCKILHAKNGQETVEICKDNSHIDLVLMDLKMPIMNGYEATKLIKEFCPDLPIVAQTAYSTTEDIDKAMSAGCDDFISKPISEDDFNEVINKFIKC